MRIALQGPVDGTEFVRPTRRDVRYAPAAMAYAHTLASKFDPIREPEEFISWAGRPHFLPYLISGLPVLAVGLAWGAVDLNMIRHITPSQIGYAVPFFALHLFPFWGAMLYMGWLLLSFRNVTYALSDRRLLLRGGAFGVSFKTFDLRSVSNASVSRGPIEALAGAGSVRFVCVRTPSQPPGTSIAAYRLQNRSAIPTESFRAIDDPYTVFKRLNEALESAAVKSEGGTSSVQNVRQVERLLRPAASHEAAIPAAAPNAAAGRAVRQIAVLGSVLMLGFFGFTVFSMLRSSPGMSRSAPASPAAATPGVAEAPEPARAPSAMERDAIACATGAAEACSRAGFGLAHGTVGAPDPQRAAPLLARGCDLGSAGACRQLAWMLSKGEGIAPDAASALARNARGCELGNGDACSAAAFALAYGQGVAQDRAAALRMAERSCGDGSHPRACAVLGDVLEGRAGDGDRARALKVYRGCCTSGDTGCCSSAERLARALP